MNEKQPVLLLRRSIYFILFLFQFQWFLQVRGGPGTSAGPAAPPVSLSPLGRAGHVLLASPVLPKAVMRLKSHLSCTCGLT